VLILKEGLRRTKGKTSYNDRLRFINELKLEIKRTARDYVIIRIGAEYTKHSHYSFKKEKECYGLVETLKEGKRPLRRYDQVAAKRLLTKEEYEGLAVCKRKQQYFNVGVKGTIRCYK